MRPKKIKRRSILRDRRRRAILLRVIVSVSVIIFLFVLILVASWQDFFRISKIKITGNMSLGESTLIASASVPLSDNYAWIWPKNFFLWYPRAEIERNLKDQYLRLLDVKTSLSGLSTINIKVTERRPTGVWCGKVINKVSPCFLIDKGGYIFDNAPKYTGSLFTHYYGEIASTSGIVGSTYLPRRFEELTQFTKNLHNENLEVTEVEYVANDSYYNIYLSNGPKLIVSDKQSYEKTFRNIMILSKNKNLDLHNTKTSLGLVYIDLRFGNKISYKEKGKNIATSSVSMSTSSQNISTSTAR